MKFPVAVLCCFSLLAGFATAKCMFSLSTDLISKNPIILLNGDVLSPDNQDGNVTLTDGQRIQLLCSGPRNYLIMSRTSGQDVEATCFNDRFTLITNGTRYHIQDFRCKFIPQADVRDVGERCNDHYKKLQIGFRVDPYRFLPKIELCFDPNRLMTYWTRHVFHTCEFSCQLATSTPFKKDFFNDTDVDGIYKNSGYDRGHLSPKCDFFSGAEKRMTFFYLNTSPQVVNFNEKNWRVLESVIRTAAKGAKKKLYVYTGSTKFVGYLKNTIPVQLYFWKVIIDKSSGKGVAFFGVNNVDSDVNSPCATIPCERLSWLSRSFIPKMSDVTRGKIYCASINSLKTMCEIFPNFDEYTGGILTTM
jgi:DNA/RNA endonuclease G (NUC1)